MCQCLPVVIYWRRSIPFCPHFSSISNGLWIFYMHRHTAPTCFSHVSPILAKLHWLPTAQRIDYKISSLSQILLHCTCLISFAFTSLPVHCVPLLTPTSFGFQHERKSSKGSMLSPISALSLRTNSPTLYVMLKHNPSSKLTKNHTSPLSVRTRLLELCVFNCSPYFSSCKTACDLLLCVSE